MNNIFENAYFGKPYKTRGGDRALYHMYNGLCHYLIIENGSCAVEDNGELVAFPYMNNSNDIISEWQEEIDEEKLEKLANDSPIWESCPDYKYKDMIESFKAGYRKAKQE